MLVDFDVTEQQEMDFFLLEEALLWIMDYFCQKWWFKVKKP